MGRVFDLLIVDDDPVQLQLVQDLVRELGLLHRCHCVSDGGKALDLLRRRPPFEKAPRPDLILLDLNMPGMHGSEVLHRIKSDLELGSIPVIMLSSSEALQDVDACYREHANALFKNQRTSRALALLREIDRFWAELATVPCHFRFLSTPSALYGANGV